MNYSRQRGVVLDVVKKSHDHPTAEMVFERAHKELPSIGIATVYRNLNQLAEIGEIRKIPQPGGNDRFDGRMEEHYHLRCPNCGELTDLLVEDREEMVNLLDRTCSLFGLDNDGGISFGTVLVEKTCAKCRERIS